VQFKIDENLHAAAEVLRQHGYDTPTVHKQGLQGGADADIANVCQQEGRAVITLDLDFSDVRHYPPEAYQGLIVVRLNDQSRASVLNIIGRIIPLLDVEPLVGNLWIVQETSVRIREGSPKMPDSLNEH
jgi:predicted nuclease of predicted toxin-antitoxin system